MIARDVAQLQAVPGFQHNAKFVACGDANLGTCSCAGGIETACSTWFPGYVIDRLGLTQSFNSVAIVPNVTAEVQVSDENARVQYFAIGVGLQHTSATDGTYTNYSTQDWIFAQGLWRQTTATATACAMYTAVQRDVADTLGGIMTSATSTSGGVNVNSASSSTGMAWYVGPPAKFDLSGAKRYLRPLFRPIVGTTACAGGRMEGSLVAVFGEPQVNPAQYSTPVKRVLVTSPCAS